VLRSCDIAVCKL